MTKTPAPRARRRDPVRIAGWALRWIAVPALIGVFVSGNLDLRSLPFFGRERETAVLLLDGQAYFGHLDDSGESGWLTLHDVYYLTDAKGAPTNVAVSLVQRGGEAHEPSDGMRINRDRVLAVERVGADSAVARAISSSDTPARARSNAARASLIVVSSASAWVRSPVTASSAATTSARSPSAFRRSQMRNAYASWSLRTGSTRACTGASHAGKAPA